MIATPTGEGARIHALQILVNLPARLKACPARTLHVEADKTDTYRGDIETFTLQRRRSDG